MNIEMIRAAARRLSGQARQTPLLSSPFLDEIAGRRVWIKAECLQRSGSFKYRGGYTAVSALTSQTLKRGVIAFSSGNHAQGVAMAARQFDAPAVILMPSDAPLIKMSNTRALGAEVLLYDRQTDDRDVICAKLSAERGLTLIRPFDDPQVIAGQGTVGLEIAMQAAELGITKAEVLVPCGGGGLTSGVALACEADAPGLQVRTVEPLYYDDARRSLACGKILRNENPPATLCDAIMTPSPGQITFPIFRRLCGSGLTITDDDAMRAMTLAFRHLKIVIEPGGAVALGAALFQPFASEGDDIIVVASGGNVDKAVFCRALAHTCDKLG